MKYPDQQERAHKTCGKADQQFYQDCKPDILYSVNTHGFWRLIPTASYAILPFVLSRKFTFFNLILISGAGLLLFR